MKYYIKAYRFRITMLLFTLFFLQNVKAQELYVGSGATFFLKSNATFTTSNTLVNLDPAGKFSVEAGNDWGSETEYVNGEVEAKGQGETKLPTGNNGVYAPVIVDHSTNVKAAYVNNAPSSGANGVDVNAVSGVAYWKLSGNAVVTLPWNESSNMTDFVNNNGGNLNAISIVGLDNGIWNLVSATQTNIVKGDLLKGQVKSDPNNEVNLDAYSEFTFGIDHQEALSINNLFLTNDIQIVSNPIKSYESSIRFTADNDMRDLQLELFDMAGVKIRTYQVNTYNRNGSIEKPNLRAGLYFLKFYHEGKQGVKKLIIE